MTRAPGGDSGGQERREKLSAETEDILDEIDDVLETNAEDFVRAYVKGGSKRRLAGGRRPAAYLTLAPGRSPSSWRAPNRDCYRPPTRTSECPTSRTARRSSR